MWRQLCILVFLNLLDSYDTIRWLRITGIEGEGNPLMRYVIEHHGMNSIYLVKGFWVIIVGVGLFLLRNKPEPHIKLKGLLTITNWIYAAVVAWGLWLVYKL
jgi:hypothetical protein